MKNSTVTRRFSFSKVMVGILNAYIITLFLILALSIILYFSSLSEDIIPKAVTAVGALSIALSSFKATRDLDYGGWLHGGFIGLFYVAFIIIVRFFVTNGAGYDLSIMLDLIIGFLIGAFAGAIGVNM